MSETMTLDHETAPLNLLADWISRDQLAQELMITTDRAGKRGARDRPACGSAGKCSIAGPA